MAKITKKNGFTLAEVLITLSIIGVVAALTIPAVTRKFEKGQYIANFKTATSTLSRAAKMVIAQDGSIDVTNPSNVYTTFVPHLKVAKECNNMAPNGNCLASSYTTLDGNAYTPWSSCGSNCYAVVLSNGMSFQINDALSDRFRVYLDTNGMKGPNVLGKDMHHVSIYYSSGAVMPSRAGGSASESTIISECPNDLITGCSASGCGGSCGLRILRGDYAENY